MFIPLEGENTVCLANVTAIYRNGAGSAILKRDGSVEHTSFAPPTLARRRAALDAKGAELARIVRGRADRRN